MPVVKESPSPEALSIWQRAQAVCFDVDSTVCVDEGIDELAAFLGAGDAVAELTRHAMGGSMPFQDALAARLQIMKPSRQSVDAFLAAHPPKLFPGISSLVTALRDHGKSVYLVSGGFRQMIDPVAALLGISTANVFANRLLFDPSSGAYAGFDEKEYTARAGGKPAALRAIAAAGGYSPIVMIGDGATDLEARSAGAADLLIGFGGVVERDKVARGADWFVRTFEPLVEAL